MFFYSDGLVSSPAGASAVSLDSLVAAAGSPAGSASDEVHRVWDYISMLHW